MDAPAIALGVARHHGDVGLRLRVVVERDRQLRIDLPRVTERAAQGVDDTPDPRGVPTALRLADREETVEQLEALAGWNTPELDEPVVLHPRPAPCPWASIERR